MIAALFAVTLQVTTTVHLAGVDLRVGTSDPLLVAVAAWVLWTGLRGGPLWPAWRIGHVGEWLAVLTAWMLVSVLNGRLQAGEWVTWGVVNRGLGWLVLAGYFLAGAWLAGAHGAAARERVVKAFLVFGWFACLYGLVLYALYIHGVTMAPLNVRYWRVEGFMDNPNAFGFAVVSLLVLQAPFIRGRPLFPAPLALAGMAVALAALVFSGSRSAWVGLVVAWPVLVVLGALRVSDIAKGAAAAVLLGGAVLYGPPLAGGIAAWVVAPGQEQAAASAARGSEGTAPTPYFLRDSQFVEHGVTARLETTREALAAWRTAPVLGLGLGTFYRMRQQKGAAGVTTIHTTLLWLLTETGLVGAGLFVAFFLVCARGLARGGDGAGRDPVLIGVFGLLLAFAATSLGTDVMYQRHLWFFAGLALAVPAAASRRPPASRGG